MLFRTISFSALVLTCAAGADADTGLDAIGYTTLKNEQGLATPSGAGITVAQVEAGSGGANFAVDQTNPITVPFIGKAFTFITSTANPTVAISVHAQTVGGFFYGSDASPAPGVSNVMAYSQDGWREKILHSNTLLMPSLVPARVANHSYIESIGVVFAFDFLTATDDL